MSKNLSDQSRTPRDEDRERDREQRRDQGKPDPNKQQQERQERGESMRRKNAGQKFVSDEDIKRRTA